MIGTEKRERLGAIVGERWVWSVGVVEVVKLSLNACTEDAVVWTLNKIWQVIGGFGLDQEKKICRKIITGIKAL